MKVRISVRLDAEARSSSPDTHLPPYMPLFFTRATQTFCVECTCVISCSIEEDGEVHASCNSCAKERAVLASELPRHGHRKRWWADECGENYASTHATEGILYVKDARCGRWDRYGERLISDWRVRRDRLRPREFQVHHERKAD